MVGLTQINMNCLLVYIAISIANINAESVSKKIKAYFNSEVVKSFENTWKNYAVTYESALGYSLKEDFGHKTMNVYINRFNKPLLIASGYFHTDNQVNLVFKDMMLEALPHLYDIDISFPLASNVMQVEASVSKIILHTSYLVFRNQSDIIFSPADQDPYKSSPFRFHQVRNVGDLAISIEGCSLAGIVVATLSGNSVNLGHHELRLKDCQYSIEIYKLGSGAPPVIANYLPKGEKGLNLETLLTRPLQEELVPKLQGAIFSEINTSAIFGNDLPKIRAKQEVLFDETKNYIDEVLRYMNNKAIENNMGTINLEDFTISWDDTFTDIPDAKSVRLSKMTLLGLDTVYASHAGGPICVTETEIIEQLRFSTLQVIGQISFLKFLEDNEFAVEISDLAVNMNLDANHNMQLEVLGWRFLEFSCPHLEFLPTESLVVGYLLNEVPKHIKSHLKSVYDGGTVKLNQEYVDEQALDGSHHYDMNTHEIGDRDQVQLNQGLGEGVVKLHHIKVKSHEEENDILNLKDAKTENHLQMKLLNADETKYDNKEIVKLHNIEAEPHAGGQGKVNLQHVDIKPHSPGEGHVKLSHVQAAPHIVESGPLKIHYVDAEPHKVGPGPVQPHRVDVVHEHATYSKNVSKKLPIKATRTKLNKERKMFTNIIHKPTKRIKFAREKRRANKLSTVSVKTIHMSDNEIHSN